MFSDPLKLKGFSMQIGHYNEKDTISGNRFELEQVFKNLILNTIEPMDEKLEKCLKSRYRTG